MSLSAEPPPPPPHADHEHEMLIQYNLRNKICAYCKRPGAEHRGRCEKLQQVFVPPPPGWRGVAAAEISGGVGGGGGAAAAVGSAAGIVDDDKIENPCPICLTARMTRLWMGTVVGCILRAGSVTAGRAMQDALLSDEEQFKRCWKLVHDRSPGRHTPASQYNLGYMYANGKGVEQDHVEAAKWYQESAEAGHIKAQNNLGLMYANGKGVKQDHVETAKRYRKAKSRPRQGMQRRSAASASCTAVTTILLTSANAAKFNNTASSVVEPTEGVANKSGCAA
eukprot:gene21070-biopygen17353